MQVKEPSAKSVTDVIWSKRREEICVGWAPNLTCRNLKISSILEFNDAHKKRKKGHHPKQKACINHSEIFC